MNLERLNVVVPMTLDVFPYEDIEDKDWPKYFCEKDRQLKPMPEEWKQIGYRVHYPTGARRSRLSEVTGQFMYNTSGDSYLKLQNPKEVSKFLTEHLVKSLLQKNASGVDVMGEYTKVEKAFLMKQFNIFPLLLNSLVTAYSSYGEKKEKDLEQDAENFSERSEATTND